MTLSDTSHESQDVSNNSKRIETNTQESYIFVPSIPSHASASYWHCYLHFLAIIVHRSMYYIRATDMSCLVATVFSCLVNYMSEHFIQHSFINISPTEPANYSDLRLLSFILLYCLLPVLEKPFYRPCHWIADNCFSIVIFSALSVYRHLSTFTSSPITDWNPSSLCPSFHPSVKFFCSLPRVLFSCIIQLVSFQWYHRGYTSVAVFPSFLSSSSCRL